MASDIYRSWQVPVPAEVFNLQAWHLLTPGLDPSNPLVIWVTQTERDLYENMRNAARKLVEIAH